MTDPHYYEVNVKWDKDRLGTMSSPELNSEIQVATPPQFPKGVAGIWSPEHLLVAAVNSCLMTTFLAIAENSKLEFSYFDSKATGKLEMTDGKLWVSEITISPVVHISNNLDIEKATKILQKSETACLISNSIKSVIIFKPEIVVSEKK